jgi:AGCS family alanine or glycine:cation symporter
VDWLEDAVSFLNTALWTWLMTPLLLGAGIYFTVRLRFLQVRGFGHMVQVMRSSTRTEHGGISSFGAFATSLAARVGTGNIAGVATALVVGGPGAIFWMWVVAFIGMCTAMIEATLAQVYKHRDEDEPALFRGGPAYYMQRGLGSRPMGVAFSLALLVAFGLVFNAVQANSIAGAAAEAWGVPEWVSGVLVAIAAGAVIFGGIRRIAVVAELVVPVMALAYLAVGLLVVVVNLGDVPAAMGLIVSSAFGAGEVAGGAIGYTVAQAIQNGAKRGLFSNEAGQGSAPNAAATADVRHPAVQGYVQSLGVFVDTIIICTTTALIILLSGVYVGGFTDGVYDTANPTGVALTQNALSDSVGAWGAPFIAVALVFFAFTSVLANYYYGETSLLFINSGNHRALPWLRAAVLVMVLFGALVKATLVWDMADVAMGFMSLLNLVAILLLSRRAFAVIGDYELQRRSGQVPAFSRDRLPDLADEVEPDVWAEPPTVPA